MKVTVPHWLGHIASVCIKLNKGLVCAQLLSVCALLLWITIAGVEPCFAQTVWQEGTTVGQSNSPAHNNAVASNPLSAPQTHNDVVDSNVVNCPQIRADYMARYPFCAQNERRHLRTDWKDYPHESSVVLGSNNIADDGTGHDTTITIPNHTVYMTKAGAAALGDPKSKTIRPQYWAVVVPAGSKSGHYLPGQGTGPPIIVPASLLGGTPQAVPTGLMPAAYSYFQPHLAFDNKNNLASAQDEELFDYEATTFGLPMSDTQFQVIDRLDNQRFLELLFDPERWFWTGRALADVQREGLSNAAAGAAEAAFGAATDEVESSLINVGNEQAGQACSSAAALKTLPQAIWMVQRCYKEIYLPLAVLLLLPGALLTQMKGLICHSFLNSSDEDTVSPLSGILRALIAVLLIPGTQLITSYAIDIGNSMTLEVQHFVNNDVLFRWSHEQTYNPPPQNYDNSMTPTIYSHYARPVLQKMEAPTTLGGQVSAPQKYWTGKGSEMGPEEFADGSHSTNLSQVIQLFINVMNFLIGSALVVLTAFQIVMMCYLFLLGPIAAALLAWPSMYGASGLFTRVFSSWLNGLVVLALWRFWWMVVLACMCTRIQCLKEMGIYAPNTQWEACMYTCFMGLLMYVPFQPFTFNPGDTVAQILEHATNKSQASGNVGGNSTAAGVLSDTQSNQSKNTTTPELLSVGPDWNQQPLPESANSQDQDSAFNPSTPPYYSQPMPDFSEARTINSQQPTLTAPPVTPTPAAPAGQLINRLVPNQSPPPLTDQPPYSGLISATEHS